MALIEFKNKPDTSSPINANNLNNNFNELNTNINNTDDKIGDLNDLETTNKSSTVVAINELNAKTDDSGWINMSLINGWASHGTQWQQPSYRKIGNQIFIRGLISGGNNDSICANLPSAYRPSKITYFNSASGEGVARGTISTNGNLTIESYTDWVDLEFSYFTD